MSILNRNERRLIKIWYDMRYPPGTYDLNLCIVFSYYAGFCSQLLWGHKSVGFKLYPLSEEEKLAIENYIEKIKDTSEGRELENYYYLLKIVINILQTYYDDDGNLRTVSKK